MNRVLCRTRWCFSAPLALILCLHAATWTSAGQPRSSVVRLVFVGDIMLADGPGRYIARGGDPFADFASVFRDADITVGNLECVIATGGQKVRKPFTFRAAPECIPLLARYFTALSAANNHSGDYGREALREQLDLMDRAGLPCFGAGRNLREAHRPLVLERNGIRIALLGYNEFKPRSFEAGPAAPGVAWSHDDEVVADIRAARSACHTDLVIPFMHWGWEFEAEPCERQVALAHKMIDAGADLVVGSHAHMTQGWERYRDKLIVYSLGNFVFDDFVEPEAKLGWILRLTVDRKGLVAWDTLDAAIDEQGVPHRVCPPRAANRGGLVRAAAATILKAVARRKARS